MMKPQIVTHTFDGTETKVLHLIYHLEDEVAGEMYVYVDPEIDLEWGCNNIFGRGIDAEPRKAQVRHIANEIAMLEPIAHNWPRDLKLSAKRLLGEALVSILENDEPGAHVAIGNARRFFKNKSKQVSRYWTLQAVLASGAMAILLGLVTTSLKNIITTEWGGMAFALILSFFAGCFGAVLFVVMRLGKQPNVDSSAERHLHFLEGVARVFAGGVAGVLISALVKLGIFLPVFAQTGQETLAMVAAAMIAGASERLAAGIVTRVENNEPITTEEQNGDN